MLIDGRSIDMPFLSSVFWDQQTVMLDEIERIDGMSPEVLQKAFDPFFTTKAIGKEPPERVPSGPADQLILVDEDDADVHAHAVMMPRELGYGVLEADDGDTALRAFESRPDVRLLFSDVDFPGTIASSAGRETARCSFLQENQSFADLRSFSIRASSTRDSGSRPASYAVGFDRRRRREAETSVNEDRNPTDDLGTRTEEQVASMADAARKSVVDAVRPVTESVRTYAQQQKTLGAEQIDGVARAAHRAAQEVESQMPGVARSVHRAASRLDGASSALRERNLEDLTTQLGEFARGQPAVFFGGAVLAGFALSRFLKTSARR